MSFAGARVALLLWIVALAGAAVPGAARAGVSIDDATVVLKPGEYIWYEDVRGGVSGRVSVVVSLPSQLVYVYRDGVLIGVSTTSTGRPGKATPIGEFTVLEKQRFHRSNKYSNAPMPFMQRLTWDGVAMHAGHLPGFPASHGCIRMPAPFARQLFALTRVGATVEVVDDVLLDPLYKDVEPAPTLRADPRGLGGEAFNVVTARADPTVFGPASSRGGARP